MAQTIGQQLKQARQERNLSIEKVVESTRIRAYYIEAIEADDFDLLPSPVQARAFLRNYADYLELSLDDLIARQVAEGGKPPSPIVTAAPTPVAPQVPGPEAAAPADSITTLDTSPVKKQNLLEKANHWLGRLRKKSPQAVESALAQEIPVPSPVTTEVVSQDSSAKAEEPKENGQNEEQPQPPAEPNPPAASRAVFNAIGDSLRQRREMLSLTFDEIERHTHVRTHYLQALESGDFDHLPSSVQGRGMLSNYATFLDMDVDNLLLQFAEGLQALRLERRPQPAEDKSDPVTHSRPRLNLPPVIRRYLSVDILVGGGLVLLLLAFAVWGTSRIIGLRGSTTPVPTAPSISDILELTPQGLAQTVSPAVTGNLASPPPAEAQTSAISIPAEGPGAVHVVVEGLQSAWVRVVVDQKLKFEGRIDPGTAYPYDGETQIEVLTGNGSAVGILYNQSDLGPMGTLGEVVDHIYTANGILNPTPTFTPSPTITPKPSITPRPSATLRPTITPRRSPTP